MYLTGTVARFQLETTAHTFYNSFIQIHKSTPNTHKARPLDSSYLHFLPWSPGAYEFDDTQRDPPVEVALLDRRSHHETGEDQHVPVLEHYK